MRWSHVGLNCRDTKLTADFYTRWFGYALARSVPVEDGAILFLRQDDTYLELFPATVPAGVPAGTPDGVPAGVPDGAPAGVPAGARVAEEGDGSALPGVIRHIAFQTEDVDAFLREMGDAADVTLGPLDFSAFIAGWKTVWLRDPDGVVVEVSQGYRDEEG